jgi:hypothetical protein
MPVKALKKSGYVKKSIGHEIGYLPIGNNT